MEAAIEPDPLRLADGWERRFVAAGERLEEMLDLYRKLGFEVVADPLPRAATEDGCAACLSGRPEYRTIYTRGRTGTDRRPRED
jgi:hypothetical protein